MEDLFKDQFNELVKAMRNKTALLIVDSSSKAEKCVFSLIYFDTEFKKYYALGTVFNGKVSCPQCKGYNTQDWEPNDGCPKCGGELENQGVTCLMD